LPGLRSTSSRAEKREATCGCAQHLSRNRARKNEKNPVKRRSNSFSRIDFQFRAKEIVAAFSTTMSFFS
jgi:hypothetical protein